MDVQISWLAVLLAVVAKMVVGMVWYSRSVFGDKWAKLVRLSDKDMQEGSTRAIVKALLAGVLTAYVLAHVAYLSNAFFGNSFLQDSLTTAFWLWLGISAATVVTHDAFEQRPKALTVLTLANEFVTLMAMGLVIGIVS